MMNFAFFRRAVLAVTGFRTIGRGFALVCAALVFAFSLVSPAAHAERLKDLVAIQGVRDNPLIGYGLVVGLDGTGDQTTQTPFTTQTLANMLANLGISINNQSAGSSNSTSALTSIQLKNVAAVMVTAVLPPF